MTRPATTTVLCLALLTTSAQAQLRADPSAAFVAWGKTASHPIASVDLGHTDWSDLEPLGRAIGHARVVALAEGVHLGHEPLAFRNRLFRYLVERLGFTAVAIESGISESRIVNRYAAGEPIGRQAAIDSGFSWQFEHAPENPALVDWIRKVNLAPGRRHQLSFYGFDVPGSPGNMRAARRMQTGLDEVLAYLDGIDSAAARAMRDRLAGFLSLDRHDVVNLYSRLSDSTRDRITAGVADLNSLLERRGHQYVARSNETDYRWALRHAGGARQMDNWLRRVDRGFTVVPGQAPDWFWNATEVRDRAMAENIQWILDREGPRSRILVYAANSHVAAWPTPRFGLPATAPRSNTMGLHLREALGPSLVTIGNVIGGGFWGCATFVFPIDSPPAPTMDTWVGQMNHPRLFLDLRRAPPAIRDWLDQAQPFGGGKEPSFLEPARAYDLLVYYARVGPVCPKSP